MVELSAALPSVFYLVVAYALGVATTWWWLTQYITTSSSSSSPSSTKTLNAVVPKQTPSALSAHGAPNTIHLVGVGPGDAGRTPVAPTSRCRRGADMRASV